MRVTRALREERGSIGALVAFSLVALLGMLVLVVDLGGLLTMRRRMVAGADAAALATAGSCARGEAGDPQEQADLLAAANEPGALPVAFSVTGCGAESSGRTRVAYEAPMDLFFAPVLGLPDEGTVQARASALWGPAGGTSPVPIEFAIDDSGQIPCAFQPAGTQCAYWFDNSNDHDLTDSSNWGFMNLGRWGVTPDASCPNAGNDERREWITGELLSNVVLTTVPTLVCVDSGHATGSWYSSLLAQVGKIKHFPINDPAAMVRTSGKEKYAIVGFAALMVERVLRGDDAEAVGIPGEDGQCLATHSFATGGTLDIDTLAGGGCPGGLEADQVTDLVLWKKQGPVTTVYQEGVHYAFDPDGHVITWLAPAEENVRVEFAWATSGSPGACGIRPRDPNAVCLVASWQGAQVGGTNPGLGQDFGLRAIRLEE